MSKKLIVLVSIILLVGGLTTNVLAVSWTDGDPADHLWSSPANWDDGVPAHPYTANIRDVAAGLGYPIIQDGINATAGQVGLNGTNAANPARLTMTGGTLTLGGGEAFKIAHGTDNHGIFEMSGGTLSLLNPADGFLFIAMGGETAPSNARGEFTMSGGEAGFSYGKIGNRYFSTTALLNLYGGVINFGGLELRPWALANITNGTLVIAGNRVSAVNSWVSGGLLVAFGGAGDVIVDYDGTKTTVTAIPEPMTIALLGLGGLFIRRRK